ncbi:MAG: hypothetical protein NTZ05_12260 [Chloroflexi bacterium]|nr:hypothetical protein [Chloroflexota bacterium]
MAGARRRTADRTRGDQKNRQPGIGELYAMENRLNQRLAAMSERITALHVMVAGGGGPSLSARLERLERQVLIAVGAERSTARFATAAAAIVGAIVGVATLLVKGGV